MDNVCGDLFSSVAVRTIFPLVNKNDDLIGRFP